MDFHSEKYGKPVILITIYIVILLVLVSLSISVSAHDCAVLVIVMKLLVLLRTLVKGAYQKSIFLISQPKLMLWVLKRTVSMRRFF